MAPRRSPSAHRPTAGQRGSVSMQMALLVPLVLGIVWLGLQAVLYYQARAVAIAAAQIGAQQAAAEHGSVTAGTTAARDFLDRSPASLNRHTLMGTRGPDIVTFTVTATAPSVIPGWAPPITQRVSWPVERITQ